MPKRIEKLKLTQFRGGSQPVIFDFKPDKSIVLIYGENGTGKSSIADAIDFVCNNEFGSLADRSGATPKQHIVSLHGQAKDVAVKIRYGGKDWEAKLQGGKPVTNPPDPPRAFILRRTDITRVMEAAPAERYKALQAYITVPNVESAERELRKAHKEMNARVERAESNRANALATLEKLWQAEGWPGGSPLAWAAAQTATGVEVQQQALDTNRRLSEGIQQALAARSALQAAQQAADNAARTLAAAQAALAAAERVTVVPCVDLTLTLPYPLYEQGLRLAQQAGAKVAGTEFAAGVTLRLTLRAGTEGALLESLAALCRGDLQAAAGKAYYAPF